MRYLRSFNEELSNNSDIQKMFDDINDCFLSVKDLWHVKITRPIRYTSVTMNTINVVINLDSNVVSIDNMKKTDWGVEYRPVKNGIEISQELVEAIDKCIKVYNLKMVSAHVKWINAGELSYFGKGHGPGMSSKGFKPDGVDGRIHDPVKGQYNIDILTDFIIDKGDRLRHLEINFEL